MCTSGCLSTGRSRPSSCCICPCRKLKYVDDFRCHGPRKHSNQSLLIQGSTYIYQTYVHPFLTKNEATLDDGIAALQSNALAFFQAKLADLFRLVTNAAGQRPAASGPATPGANPAANANGAAWQAAAAGLWDTYGASVINSLRPQPGSAAVVSTPGAVSTAGGQRSNPTTPNQPRASAASTQKDAYGSSSAVPTPPFPVPQFFQQPQ